MIIATINTNFYSFSEIPILGVVFSGFVDEYEYTTNNIFHKKNPPSCPKCDKKWYTMVLTCTLKRVWTELKSVNINVNHAVKTSKKIEVFGKNLKPYLAIC